MNALEKTAWTELLVSIAAVTAVTLLIPWMGHRAAGAFGIMGFIGFSVVFLRRRGQQVIIDERDLEISRRATAIGIGAAWMVLFMSLIAATLWSGYTQKDVVPIAFLNWLIWIQFAICYGIKGLSAVVMYRRQHAA
jgi:hypothetical protein